MFEIIDGKNYSHKDLPLDILQLISESYSFMDEVDDGPVMCQLITKYIVINGITYRVKYILHFDSIQNDIDSGFGVIFNFTSIDLQETFNRITQNPYYRDAQNISNKFWSDVHFL